MNAGMHLTTDELSERLRVSVRTLESWRNKREGPPFAKFGESVVSVGSADRVGAKTDRRDR
jgi:hypothetical protein